MVPWRRSLTLCGIVSTWPARVAKVREILTAGRAPRIALVLVLLTLGFALQVRFLARYPQPVLFGDAAAYYSVGQRFQQAAARLAEGEPVETAIESVRGYLHFAGVGAAYALIDALQPRDIAHFRIVLAGFNTLAMLACFLLGRRLAGGYAGGLVALTMAVVYPPFAVQTGRILPDPITGCAFVWAACFYARGVERRSATAMVAAGLALGAALLIRSQLIAYVGALLALALAVTAPRWWRSGASLACALALGFLPAAVLWLVIVRAVGGDLRQIEALGNFTFQQRYPYGFWQFLDTDGFMGPYRLGQEPYYRALESAAAADPGLLESYPRQLAFTTRYVASRASESVPLVLDNVYRLFDRPANDYKWDYPIAYSRQVPYQRAIVLLAVAGAAVFSAARPALAGVFFVPACLALLHGLSYPWPRFNQPAMPILIASAGAFVAWLARERGRRAIAAVLVALAAAGALFAVAAGTRMALPDVARWLRLLGIACLIGAPFAAAVAVRHRRALVAAGLAVLVLAAAHESRSRAWHETGTRLGEEVVAVEQTITLSPESLHRLRAASEAFVVVDLLVPNGNPGGLSAVVNGREIGADGWIPTMPRFGESTAAGGRDRRGYRQWWALRLDPAMLAGPDPRRVRIELRRREGAPVVVYGDRFRDQQAWYEGPSFGDWPHLAAVKLEYDGDYRLPVRRRLESERTQSRVVARDGTRSHVASVHRIRIVALATNEGRLSWETAPAPVVAPTRELAIGFFAYSGRAGSAELLVGESVVARLPLGSTEDFEAGVAPHRLCHRAEPPRGDMAYGGYVLVTPATRAGALPLGVRFRSGMSAEPLFFSLDQRGDAARLASLLAACAVRPSAVPVDGVGRVLDASANHYPETTGRWSVAALY
jgi:4-amino-4-deoxy-L-arabinose transferase-like glycosyltransferase